MRQLRSAGATISLSQSGSVNVIQQMIDMIRGVQSDIIQILSEYNSEVYPILNSLPQGRSETRWNFTDDTLSAKRNGLDGTQLLVDSDASITSDGGRYWREDSSRPRTIKESFSNLYSEVLNQINQLRTEISSTSSDGISNEAIGGIGARIFDSTQTSALGSLDRITHDNQTHLLQLARDLYDDSYDAWTSNGAGLLNTKSVRDMVDDLLQIHYSSWNTGISPSHIASSWQVATSGDSNLVIDCNNGHLVYHALIRSVILGTPLNPTEGQELVLYFSSAAGTTYTVSFSSSFKIAGELFVPSYSPTQTKRDILTLIYREDTWHETSRSQEGRELIFAEKILQKSSNYTMTENDFGILASGSGTIITLPTGITAGARFLVKRNDASNSITVSSGSTIDGASSIVLSSNYDWVEVVSDGSNYLIVG